MTVKRKNPINSVDQSDALRFYMPNLPQEIPVMIRNEGQKCTASYSDIMCD